MNVEPIKDLTLNLLRRICERIILHPDELKITSTSGQAYFSIRIRAQVSDTSRLIGEKGTMFRALRTIVQEIGAHYDVTVDMERIEEPTEGKRDSFSRFKMNEHANLDDLQTLLWNILQHTMKDPGMTTRWEDAGVETHVAVAVSVREASRTVNVMNEALRVVFLAMGKARGKILYLNISNEPKTTYAKSK